MGDDESRHASTRKKGTGRRRGGGTLRECELRERAFFMHIEGYTVRQIGAALDISKDLAAKYVRVETELRRGEFEKQREAQTFRSVAFYDAVKRRSLKRASKCDDILSKIESGELEHAKVSDHSFADATKAQERIDKILGIDAPTKIDAGVDKLVEALLTRADESVGQE